MVTYVDIIGLCHSVVILRKNYVMRRKCHMIWLRLHVQRMLITNLVNRLYYRNYYRKLLQEIMTGNYYRKLVQEIMTGKYQLVYQYYGNTGVSKKMVINVSGIQTNFVVYQ